MRAIQKRHPTPLYVRFQMTFFFPNAKAYFPNSSTRNVPGTMLGRGCGFSVVGAGTGPYSAVQVKRWWVLGSRASVRARVAAM